MPPKARRRPLRSLLLVFTVPRHDRLHITERYKRFFGGVAYVVWPRSGLNETHCATRGLACLVADDAAALRTPAYERLFGDLSSARRDNGTFAPRAAWLQTAWRRPDPPSGCLVAHMDYWFQPLAFSRRLARGALDASAIWTLAAGLNAPPTGPPPASQHLRVYGKSCLRGADLRGECDWTWGHGVREAAIAAARDLEPLVGEVPAVCATQADFFYAPRAAFALLGAAARTFRAVAHEVAAPTILAAAARRLNVRRLVLDCWGCTQSWCFDPAIIKAHACGHKLDLRQPWVRHAWRELLDAQASALGATGSKATEAAIARLDAAADDEPATPPHYATLPCCRDRTHGCCRLPGMRQTACACVARDPPRPPGNGTSDCLRADLVPSALRSSRRAVVRGVVLK